MVILRNRCRVFSLHLYIRCDARELDVYGSIDDMTTSLDSSLFAGGKALFSGTRGNKIVTFTGAPAQALITTGDIGGDQKYSFHRLVLLREFHSVSDIDIAVANIVQFSF